MASERKVALVTGGAKRVGRAVVERLLRAGYEVAFTYFRSTAQDLSWAASAGARAYQADLTDTPRAASALAAAVLAEFGRLDALVNNASLYEPGPLADTDVRQLRRLMAIHVETPLLLCQAFAPALREARGRIVNMVDLLAERPWPHYVGYCASKSALANLTLALARELAPEVTVNGIAPGVVEWPDNYPEADRAKYLKRVPLQRPGTPQDVAELVHFLCTAGSYLTGQILRLDGGRSVT